MIFSFELIYTTGCVIVYDTTQPYELVRVEKNSGPIFVKHNWTSIISKHTMSCSRMMRYWIVATFQLTEIN